MTTDENPADERASPSDPESPPARFEWVAAEKPSVTIVEAVAAATGRDATALPPLHDSIDPDALNGLLESKAADLPTGIRVSFRYDGIEVTADSHAGIEVRTDDD